MSLYFVIDPSSGINKKIHVKELRSVIGYAVDVAKSDTHEHW